VPKQPANPLGEAVPFEVQGQTAASFYYSYIVHANVHRQGDQRRTKLIIDAIDQFHVDQWFTCRLTDSRRDERAARRAIQQYVKSVVGFGWITWLLWLPRIWELIKLFRAWLYESTAAYQELARHRRRR
jgi:hypothetical protein